MATPEPPHPFNKATADVILRSSDNIEFRVHKLILAEASPVFEDMFKLPQPVTGPEAAVPETSTKADSTTLPVVDLTETGKTLDALLRLCYPTESPLVPMEEIRTLIEAARKYDMQWAISRAEKTLTQRGALEDALDALRVFAIASDLNLHAAEVAARASLPVKLGSELPVELHGITPSSLYRLLQYRERVHDAVVRFLMDPSRWTYFTDELDIRPQASYYDSPRDSDDTIIIPRELYRRDHDHYDYDPYDTGPILPDIRVDQPEVILALVEQAKASGYLPTLRIPGVLMTQICRLPCAKCVSEATTIFHNFLDYLRGEVEDIVLCVTLDPRED